MATVHNVLFSLTINGSARDESKNVQLTETYESLGDIEDAIQDVLDAEYGAGAATIISINDAESSLNTPGVEITNAAPVSTAQSVTIQLSRAAITKISVYMATSSAGAISVAGAGGNVTATTGAILKAVTAKLYLDVITDATGKAVINVSNASGGALYTDRLAVILPDGSVNVGAALAVPNA